MKQPQEILAIFDDGGETVDRYTIVLSEVERSTGGVLYYDMLALGDDVTSPQGFSQCTSGVFSPNGDNSHLGKEIQWEELSETHRKHIIGRLSNEG